ncbi:hypothetical protein CYMTET_44369 [Cymbomonas tetramitiformis]|uniref:Sulfatase N-terminal domain-containing protein n=1 Tax=Cymbomonas tetramitiformis TaxID=36881 RepID=A0AAE0F0R7_9CHLO|nr:hypothetical protein CYMTET_44369 [Cymbomonas tetramitiformis]
MGWGDLGANWHEAEGLTPNLDKFAKQGIRFTDAHTHGSTCTPSRSAFMTGREVIRTGMNGNVRPGGVNGLPVHERILSNQVKACTKRDAKYRTGAIGKWHLGITEGYHPLNRDFDDWLGLPASLDEACGAKAEYVYSGLEKDVPVMCPACPALDAEFGFRDWSEDEDSLFWQNNPPPPAFKHEDRVNFELSARVCAGVGKGGGCYSMEGDGLSLHRDHQIVQQPVDKDLLSKHLSEHGVHFIKNASKNNEPFFLYYAAAHVHSPQAHSQEFADKIAHLGLKTGLSANKNGGKHFAASLLEMDDEFGQLMTALDEEGLKDNTLVIFISDNGPPGCRCNMSGSVGPFRGEYQQQLDPLGGADKATAWEGGQRVPMLMRWPGVITPGRVSSALISTMDLFPTISEALSVPVDATIDGYSMMPLLRADPSADEDKEQHYMIRDRLSHPLFVYGHDAYAGLRIKKYKAMYATGYSNSCNEGHPKTSKGVDWHHKPLIFDLHQDEAETTPLEDNKENAAIFKEFQEYFDVIAAMTHEDKVEIEGGFDRMVTCCNPRMPTGCGEGLIDIESSSNAKKYCELIFCGCDSYNASSTSNLPGKVLDVEHRVSQYKPKGYVGIDAKAWTRLHLKEYAKVHSSCHSPTPLDGLPHAVPP